MADIEGRAKEQAEKDFEKYAGKSSEFLAEKYAEFSNREEKMMDKINKNDNIKDDDLYTYFYCHSMVERLSWVLANFMLYGMGYEKDKNRLWTKKKKGFFR